MSKILVAGAGVMGKGVAQTLVEYNNSVILYDTSKIVLDNSLNVIERNIRMKTFFSKVKINVDELIKKITITDSLDHIDDCDFVIENITEDEEKKRPLYYELNKLLSSECIIMANTSCISITKLASFTNRASNIIGTHFMNPVPLIPSVEVIRGYHTSEETLSKVTEFLSSIGKEAIVVNDLPGFVSNRISHLMMNEAAFILQDGVADAASIDDIFKKCYGHKMGPLETADLIGIDTVVNSLNVLYTYYQDSKFRCCPLLKKMMDAGLLGRKSGQGFYKYD